jgi:hypothetical protein
MYKLIPPETNISELGHSLVNPSEKFNPITIPTSNRPATNNKIHAISIAPLSVLASQLDDVLHNTRYISRAL